MQTLSKGYKKPQNPDTGDVWFPAMEQNIQQLNDHTHNGVDSQFLAVTTQTISNASWGSDLGGSTYRQLVTLPTGIQYDSTRLEFRLTTGEVVYPTVERVSSTTYYVYTNDNTVSYTAIYG